jgi:hypothetical protein
MGLLLVVSKRSLVRRGNEEKARASASVSLTCAGIDSSLHDKF